MVEKAPIYNTPNGAKAIQHVGSIYGENVLDDITVPKQEGREVQSGMCVKGDVANATYIQINPSSDTTNPMWTGEIYQKLVFFASSANTHNYILHIQSSIGSERLYFRGTDGVMSVRVLGNGYNPTATANLDKWNTAELWYSDTETHIRINGGTKELLHSYTGQTAGYKFHLTNNRILSYSANYTEAKVSEYLVRNETLDIDLIHWVLEEGDEDTIYNIVNNGLGFNDVTGTIINLQSDTWVEDETVPYSYANEVGYHVWYQDYTTLSNNVIDTGIYPYPQVYTHYDISKDDVNKIWRIDVTSPNPSTLIDMIGTSVAGNDYVGAHHKISFYHRGTINKFTSASGANYYGVIDVTQDWQYFEYEFDNATLNGIIMNMYHNNSYYNHAVGQWLEVKDIKIEAISKIYPITTEGSFINDTGSRPTALSREEIGLRLFKGKCQYTPKIVNQPCLTSDGTQTLSFANLTGINIVSYEGTSTAAKSGNAITLTAGTIYNLILDDGTLLPLQEGDGRTVYAVGGTVGNGTIINYLDANWTDNTQDSYARNALLGYNNMSSSGKLFTDFTNDLGGVDYASGSALTLSHDVINGLLRLENSDVNSYLYLKPNSSIASSGPSRWVFKIKFTTGRGNGSFKLLAANTSSYAITLNYTDGVWMEFDINPPFTYINTTQWRIEPVGGMLVGDVIEMDYWYIANIGKVSVKTSNVYEDALGNIASHPNPGSRKLLEGIDLKLNPNNAPALNQSNIYEAYIINNSAAKEVTTISQNSNSRDIVVYDKNPNLPAGYWDNTPPFAFSNALEFDGVNDYLSDLNDNTLYNTSNYFTISFWFYLQGNISTFLHFINLKSTIGQSMVIATADTSRNLYSGITVNFGSNSIGFGPQTQPAPNQWNHVAITGLKTNSGSTGFICNLNGVTLSNRGAGGYGAMPNTTRIGYSSNNNYKSPVILDEIAYYDNHQATPSELSAFYNSGFGDLATNVIASPKFYLRLDGSGADSIAADSSGNAINFALNNFTFPGAWVAHIDSDAEAYITAASIVDPTEIAAVNQLFLDLKGAGNTTNNSNIYSKFFALYPISPTSLAASAVNAVNPSTYDITWFNSPTHAANGVTGNGTNMYGSTNFIPDTSGASENNFGITLDIATSSGGGVDFGSNSYIHLAMVNPSYTYILGSIGDSIGGTSYALGIRTMVRRAANDMEAYLNGSTEGSKNNLGNWSFNSDPLYIFCRNNGTNPAFFSNRRYRFCAIHEGLTSNEAKDLSDSINTYNTALSR